MLQQADLEDRYQIEAMIKLIDTCISQIIKPHETVIYVAECVDTTKEEERFAEDGIITSQSADLTFHDEMEKMVEYLNNTYRPNSGEPNREIYVYQIVKPPNRKHRVKIEFSMTWLDGQLEIFNVYPNKEWLERKWIPEEIVDDFYDRGICYRELPFKEGDRLKIKTPLMSNYIYGTLTYAEYDGCGCWYYFFSPDGKETDIDAPNYDKETIDLSLHRFKLTSGYAIFDWVERS